MPIELPDYPAPFDLGGDMSAVELNALVRDVGSEQWLAQRIAVERRARGWSQSELARQMNAVGLPQFNQTAVSEIEAGVVEGKPRRRIRVDEAIAFASVFRLSLLELLLPPAVVKHHQALRDIRSGPPRAMSLARIKSEYADAVDRVARGVLDASEVATAYETARDNANRGASRLEADAAALATQFFQDVDERIEALRKEQP